MATLLTLTCRPGCTRPSANIDQNSEGKNQMPPFGKAEFDVHINSAAEKFHENFINGSHHIANVSPDKVKTVVLHQGDWGKEGSIIIWNFVLDGKACVAKELVEAIDTERNLITFRFLEGDVLDHYKSFKATIQVTPKDNKGSVVHWTLEYEKLHPQVPDPHSMIQLAIDLSNDIDAQLTP
ncbi:MLP-like protein 43 [Prosopis cineraria]|uniref:MLP-like protein 43 n=1 Tax=Prosopis cineraria TaxID=364024 RepID=UPI00240FCFAF|nr:MLP-like protein 43 [Prosopis cineraria]